MLSEHSLRRVKVKFRLAEQLEKSSDIAVLNKREVIVLLTVTIRKPIPQSHGKDVFSKFEIHVTQKVTC